MKEFQHFIVATAGHVDHGKSAIVKALIGTDPDRLPEEKARGITIDLGFAHLELPASTPELRRFWLESLTFPATKTS
jgi:selenocysteine-specific translation elongation factor